ncbi:MAG TPA: hypothetical protein VIY29_03590 [Ktedonobacteraceae bacterium]
MVALVEAFKRLVEAIRQLPQTVQVVLALCLLAGVGIIGALFILVALNPVALGGVVGLVTVFTSTIAFLFRKGPPPAPGH